MPEDNEIVCLELALLGWIGEGRFFCNGMDLQQLGLHRMHL